MPARLSVLDARRVARWPVSIELCFLQKKVVAMHCFAAVHIVSVSDLKTSTFILPTTNRSFFNPINITVLCGYISPGSGQAHETRGHDEDYMKLDSDAKFNTEAQELYLQGLNQQTVAGG